MTFRPMASIGTPATIAGRVQARNSGSSVSRSSGFAATSAARTSADHEVDEACSAEDHDDPHDHRAGAPQVQVTEHPGDAGEDDRDDSQPADHVRIQYRNDVLDEAADVAAAGAGGLREGRTGRS